MNLLLSDVERRPLVLDSSQTEIQAEIVGRLSSIVAQIVDQNRLARSIAVTDHLVDSGMTSMAMVDLMLAVEAEFDITIPQREMTPSNFQSIASLAQMLGRI